VSYGVRHEAIMAWFTNGLKDLKNQTDTL